MKATWSLHNETQLSKGGNKDIHVWWPRYRQGSEEHRKGLGKASWRR